MLLPGGNLNDLHPDSMVYPLLRYKVIEIQKSFWAPMSVRHIGDMHTQSSYTHTYTTN